MSMALQQAWAVSLTNTPRIQYAYIPASNESLGTLHQFRVRPFPFPRPTSS